MRIPVTAALLGACFGVLHGQSREKTVQTFDGPGPKTTPSFQVSDQWEVRSDAAGPLTLTILAPDGSTVARVSGSGKISLYEPKGGSFHLQIEAAAAGALPASWHVAIVETNPGMSESLPMAQGPTNVPPSVTAPPPAVAPSSSAAATPPAAAAPLPDGSLSPDEANAVVLIKGDQSEGTGFLARTAEGPVVITNLHVISANPNVKITTSTGQEIKVLSLEGAVDRDLARFTIQDDHYTYLPLSTAVGSVEVGDATVIPGNSEGGEVMLDTKGDVLGVGPQKIEYSNPVYHGNSGGPVIHLKSGKVIAVVEGVTRVRPSDEFDQASLKNINSAITGQVRYFGLRIDTVPSWETYDPARFQNETLFLKAFHETSRALDSYLNGARYEKARLTSENIEEGEPNSKYYLKNDKIRAVDQEFRQQADGADQSQRLDAQREGVMDLEGLADQDMASIQNPANFYAFDEIRAKEEITYRQALKKELESMEDKISELGH
jgi:S1-C subfamily serine protease